jgi:hypothetical protein
MQKVYAHIWKIWLKMTKFWILSSNFKLTHEKSIKNITLQNYTNYSFFGSYTIDIISSCCFGMEVNSINDPGNEFIKQLTIANSTNFRSPKVALLCKIFDYLSMC